MPGRVRIYNYKMQDNSTEIKRKVNVVKML